MKCKICEKNEGENLMFKVSLRNDEYNAQNYFEILSEEYQLDFKRINVLCWGCASGMLHEFPEFVDSIRRV